LAIAVRGRGYEFVAVVTESEVLPTGDVGSASADIEQEPQEHSARTASFPAPMQALIGRDKLLAELQDELAEFRLVALIWPGGVGKTTVA